VPPFTVAMDVSDPKGQQSRSLSAEVHTNVDMPVLPSALLSELRLVPVRRQSLRLPDGRRLNLPVGYVRVTIEGRNAGTLSAFGADDLAPIVGRMALQATGLVVDHAAQRLAPAPGTEER
jgi:hypothetical protein